MKKSKSFYNMLSKQKHLLMMFALSMFFFLGATQVEAQSKTGLSFIKEGADAVAAIENRVAMHQVSVATLDQNSNKAKAYNDLIAYYNLIVSDLKSGVALKQAIAAHEELKPPRIF